ncbi:gliding motility-associated C-terminal domain-containing protein [Flavobacterium sp. 123]|uniref:T9SS type B sorting domain-containing protein n=1 Tax=Flavobacterium sp. 123 TaxID=2135627 RepID=UPI000EAF3774|nr:gliding motility-associated C-terminal domain-containing protein [Flavobacterium sp. 123]RKT00767.1 gliding motility-associated-like protein [Flavobacterium sp. 123]
MKLKNYLPNQLIKCNQESTSYSKKVFLFFAALFLTVASSYSLEAQNVSLTFSKGYLGTQGSNTNQANSINNLSNIGINRISFSQAYAGAFGGTQGNDLSGNLTFYLANGTSFSLTGALNWRETSGSTVEVFGFIFDSGQNHTITYGLGQTYNIVGGSTPNTSTTLGLKAYASSFVFVNGENRAGNAATNGLLDALNAELLSSPQPSTVTLSTANVTEGQNLVYNVTLSSATTVGNPQTFVFTYGGTSTNGSDYNSTFTFSNGVIDNGDGTITVPGGVSSFTITASTTDDSSIESTETLILNIGSKSDSGNILDNDSVALTASTSQTNLFCFGGSNGTASVVVSGGTAPYSYSWSPSGGTWATASGLTAGNYTVTITDDNLATITKNFTITEPSAITASASQTNVSCNGGSNGTASVTPSGGAGSYTYSWSPSGGTGATASGLSAGSYTVTIEDANGCSATRNFTITEPSAIAASASQTNIACNGGATGSASVTPSGGAGSYTYSWSPSGGTGATASGLTAGNYTVTITDANLCTATRNFTITEPSAITATTSQTNTSCNGSTDGIASVIASGGTGSYSYSWSPSGGTAATATGLAAGNYTCTITDLNGCSIDKNFTIALSSSWNDFDCDGDGVTNGTEVTDGTNPDNSCSFTASSITLNASSSWNTADCDGDNVTNGQELLDGTDPNKPDTDGDGVTDGKEKTDETDATDPCKFVFASQSVAPSSSWNTADCDGDNVTNGQEKLDGTDSNKPDTDGDGVTDGKEKTDATDATDPCKFVFASQSVTPSSSWNTADCDGDTITNGQEKLDGTDPTKPDTDGDGVTDDKEKTDATDATDPCKFVFASQSVAPSSSWNTGDCDGDNVTNGQEKLDGTDPNVADTDGDGVTDDKEKTDVTDATDACQFILASQSVAPRSSWNTADCDGDNVSNGQEKIDGTDPLKPDTDGDGVTDGTEKIDGTNAKNTCDYLAASQTLSPSALWNDADCDNDGIRNGDDNCVFTANANQTDNDNDGLGDTCDDDDDNDGILDTVDNCPLTPNSDQADRDHDGKGDVCDLGLNVSQAITPNGDGINDTWMIYNIEQYPNSTVRVFNRWGSEIFYAHNYRNDWDGHYKNKNQSLPETSAYYYQIDIEGNGSVDLEGWIYLTK